MGCAVIKEEVIATSMMSCASFRLLERSIKRRHSFSESRARTCCANANLLQTSHKKEALTWEGCLFSLI